MRSTKRPSSISLQDAQMPQGVAVTPVSQLRHFDEDARDGGLAHAARAGEQEGVMHAPLRQCIAQARRAHVPVRRAPRRTAVATYARARDSSSFGQSSFQELEGGSPHQPDFGARHRRYRCSLPGLTGFTTSRREGADTDCHGKEVADRQGFEPWNTVRCYLLSKQAPSTARPPVRGADDTNSSLFRLRLRPDPWDWRTAAECRDRARPCRERAPACRVAGL